jgi:hypothetical protein
LPWWDKQDSIYKVIFHLYITKILPLLFIGA